MQLAQDFLNAVAATYGCLIESFTVVDPTNPRLDFDTFAVVITGQGGHHDLPEMILRDLNALGRWPIAATGSKANASVTDPLFVYDAAITEPAILFLFSQRKD